MSRKPDPPPRHTPPCRSPIDGHAPSLYAAECAPIPARPVLDGDRRCDVCIVGGGFTGLSTALDLAGRGFSVVLLEAERLGWGASGRNGGQFIPGYAGGYGRLVAAVGPDDARRIWQLGLDAADLLHARIADHGIDCQVQWGYLHAALTPAQMGELTDMVAVIGRAFDISGFRLRDKAGLAAVIGSGRYVGGLSDSQSGHLQPLRYALGLAGAAERAGAALFEHSPVTAIDQNGRCRAVTATGTVTADYLVLAGNAHLGGVAPAIRSRVMPAGTYIIATEPLDADLAGRLLPTNAAVADCNFVLDYFRLSQDRRMLFGGGVSYSTLPPPNLAAAMRRRMLRVFPALAPARIDYAWGGHVAITPSRLPHFGRIGRRILFAQGFSGQGVILTGMAGRLMADAIAGDAGRFDLMSKIPIAPFPGGRLMRMPLLVLASTYYRLRDWL